MADHKADISAELREAREATGLTQAEAAQALGLHGITISRWETGARNPSSANYERTMAFYRRRLSQMKPADAPRGTMDVSRSAGPWPDLISRFGRVAIRRGATDAEVDFLQAALATPEATALVLNEMPPADHGNEKALFRHAQHVFAGLIVWVEQRVGERREGNAFDVPPVELGETTELDEPGGDEGRRQA